MESRRREKALIAEKIDMPIGILELCCIFFGEGLPGEMRAG
jgi:hypothetical protein